MYETGLSHRLIVFWKKVLRVILGQEKGDVTWGWGKATPSCFLLCIFCRYCYSDQIMEAVMTSACNTHGRYGMLDIFSLKTRMAAVTWKTQK